MTLWAYFFAIKEVLGGESMTLWALFWLLKLLTWTFPFLSSTKCTVVCLVLAFTHSSCHTDVCMATVTNDMQTSRQSYRFQILYFHKYIHIKANWWVQPCSRRRATTWVSPCRRCRRPAPNCSRVITAASRRMPASAWKCWDGKVAQGFEA